MGAERTLKKVLMIVLAIFVAAAVLVFVLTHLFRGEPRTLELGSFETAATLQIDNYPVLGPDGTRQTDDPDHIDRARAILEHATFVEWLDYDQYQKDQIGTCGGSFTGLTLYDATGKELVSVTYNPGYSDYAPNGSSVALFDGRLAYVMQGDQEELIRFADECVEEARAENGQSTNLWRFVD